MDSVARSERRTPVYASVVGMVFVAFVLAAFCGGHGGYFSAFGWSLAGLGTAYALDVIMDAGSRTRRSNG
jgi:hypothetical protein